MPFQVDHIIAEKHGGTTTDSNLALSCYYCNSFKGPNIVGIDPFGDPDTAIQLFHPRKDHWASHFKWTGPELVGVTPDGRVTIAVLRINEPDAISFRELLLDPGFVLLAKLSFRLDKPTGEANRSAKAKCRRCDDVR